MARWPPQSPPKRSSNLHLVRGRYRWERQEPRHLVKVEFERTCFATRPTMRETIDIFLVTQAGRDIADPDPDKAYFAKDFYRREAWAEFGDMPRSSEVRAGFSSWTTTGEPEMVKVLNAALDRDIARQTADAEVDAPGPRAP